MRTFNLGSNAAGKGQVAALSTQWEQGESRQWVDNPLRSGACGHHAAASTPAFSAVQFLVRPSEFRLRPRAEMEGPSFVSMVGGPFPSAVWGRGAEEGAESTGSVGLGISFRGSGWLDRGWVDGVGTTAQTVHPGMGVVVQPQGWGPRTGHRPALTPGLDTQASPGNVGTQTADFLLAMGLMPAAWAW